MKLKENLEQAVQNPEQDVHLALQLRRLFKRLENGDELPDRITDELEEIEELPLGTLFNHLVGWYKDGDYSDATDALNKFSELTEEARHRDWNNVATAFAHEHIKFKAGLSGHSSQNEIENINSHLCSYYQNIHSNLMKSVFEIVYQNIDDLSEDEIYDWLSLTDDIASFHRERDEFMEERHYLTYTIQFSEELEEDTEPVQERLIESYDEEAELTGGRSSTLQADVLERGLERCVEFLTDEKQEEWKRKAVDARQDAVENEMTEISLEEELLDAVVEERQENIERLVKWFETRRETHRSSTYALYCLLCSDCYVPSYEQALNAEHGLVFTQMVETQVTSPEGHAIATNPTLREIDEEQMRVPNSYVQNLIGKNNMLSGALYRLIDRRSLTEFDFYTLLAIAPFSTETRSFLVDGVIELFDGNFAQSFALCIPHIEAAVVDTLNEQNRSAAALSDEGTQQQTLGGLFEKVQSDLRDEYGVYLQIKYTDPRGPNLRNRWSHGQLRYFQANFQNAAILLVDILKTTIQLYSTPFTAVFGFPMMTISTKRRRQEGMDISRYVESVEKVRAYGYREGAGVIVVEDEEQNKISFIVVRGGVRQEYGEDEASISRDEVAEHIELLKSPAPSLPEDIELTWVETDEEIREHILDIIESLAGQKQQPLNQSQVVEIAEKYGISTEQAKKAIDRLISDGTLNDSEDGLTLIEPEQGED